MMLNPKGQKERGERGEDAQPCLGLALSSEAMVSESSLTCQGPGLEWFLSPVYGSWSVSVKDSESWRFGSKSHLKVIQASSPGFYTWGKPEAQKRCDLCTVSWFNAVSSRADLKELIVYPFGIMWLFSNLTPFPKHFYFLPRIAEVQQSYSLIKTKFPVLKSNWLRDLRSTLQKQGKFP